MTEQFGAAVLEYFIARAVDPAVAHAAGVTEDRGELLYPYGGGRRRRLDGAGPKVRQPPGTRLEVWWPAGRTTGHILVCEGESDALAALTALQDLPADYAPYIGEQSVCAIPGTGYPAGRLADALADAEHVTLAMDGDDAGRAYAARAAAELAARDVAVTAIPFREGEDLAGLLAAVAADERGQALADLILAAPEPGPAADGQRAAGRGPASSPTPDEAELGALGAVPAYPVDALGGAAGELVRGSGLPGALVGGAALAALAAAIGSQAQVQVARDWHERAVLWVALIAPRGAGKSPAQALALGPLRDHDSALDRGDSQDGGDEGEEREARVLIGDVTLEALARELHAMGGAGALDLDELAVLLRGLGEYKRAGGGDRGRILGLWTGHRWSYARVGSGTRRNAVRLHLPRPTVVICGGLQPALHELLGGDEDGLRPRWLPHVAAMPDTTEAPGDRGRGGWAGLLGELLAARGRERTWLLTADAKHVFAHYRRGWKAQARNGEAASITGALVKADVHLARVALVLAEAQRPAAGGALDADVIHRAATLVEYVIAGWRALPEVGTLALSRRDTALDGAIDRLAAWLEERQGGRAARRELQRARVAGVRTASDLDALLERYEAIYPGSVTEERSSRGGPPSVIVAAPRRREYPTVTSGDSGIGPGVFLDGYAESGTVTSGDSPGGDSGGDSAPAAARTLADPAGDELVERVLDVFPGAAEMDDREWREMAADADVLEVDYTAPAQLTSGGGDMAR